MPGLKNAREACVSACAELWSAASCEVGADAWTCTVRGGRVGGKRGHRHAGDWEGPIGGRRTSLSAESASWTSPRTSWPTGMFSIWSTRRTMLERVSELSRTFSAARRRRSASSSQSVNGSGVPSAGGREVMPSGRPGTPSSVRSWAANVLKTGSRCDWERRGEGSEGFKTTTPPHCGRRKAVDGSIELSSVRMRRGLWLAEGTKRTKWITGSLDTLDAVRRRD